MNGAKTGVEAPGLWRADVEDSIDAVQASFLTLAKSMRATAEAAQQFGHLLQALDNNSLPPRRLPCLAYRFTGTDGAVCEASRLGFSPDAGRWPAGHN